MTPLDALLVGGGAFLAGGMNALAGGGSFFSFPALLAVGVPPVLANASNTVALWPASLASAWAYRRELARHRAWVAVLSGIALVGGALGGLLLLATSNASFTRLIPWLLLVATLLFAFSDQIGRVVAKHRRVVDSAAPRRGSAAGWLFQLLVSIYGGFFGAGQGILLLAALSIQGIGDIQELNAIKNWLSALVYTVAALTFVLAQSVSWPHTLTMLVTAILGGHAGALLARRLPARGLRWLVVGVGAVLTVVYFIKTWR
ncbi:MAG TPA: sulfite exporter TauE/SafE family protein [Albitalea sp.]|nr:sulfite exporter TauE/SafE family protein [Albitalea sp.]